MTLFDGYPGSTPDMLYLSTYSMERINKAYPWIVQVLPYDSEDWTADPTRIIHGTGFNGRPITLIETWLPPVRLPCGTLFCRGNWVGRVLKST